MQVTPLGWVMRMVHVPSDEVNTSNTRPDAVTPMAVGDSLWFLPKWLRNFVLSPQTVPLGICCAEAYEENSKPVAKAVSAIKGRNMSISFIVEEIFFL